MKRCFLKFEIQLSIHRINDFFYYLYIIIKNNNRYVILLQ